MQTVVGRRKGLRVVRMDGVVNQADPTSYTKYTIEVGRVEVEVECFWDVLVWFRLLGHDKQLLIGPTNKLLHPLATRLYSWLESREEARVERYCDDPMGPPSWYR